jgi:hypothetical protein
MENEKTENTENAETVANDAAKKRLKSLKKAKRMLKELYSVAENSALTGAFQDGANAATQSYNQILAYVLRQDIDLEGMFPPLPEDSTYDTIAVASRVLRGYVECEIEEAEESEENNSEVNISLGSAGNRIHLSKGNKHINLEDLGTIKDIGKIIRDNLPDFMKNDYQEAEKERQEAERDRREAERDARDAERERREAERERREEHRED